MTYANDQDILEFGHDCVKCGARLRGEGVMLKSEGFPQKQGQCRLD